MSVKKRITENFDKQAFMKTLGAELVSIETGEVRISCKYEKKLTQQNGFFHAGVLTSVVDSACCYAALSVMPENADVLSVEFKMNLLRPANTEKIIAIGTVLKAGKKIIVCEGTIYDATENKMLCRMNATMFCVTND
ncbi:MAG: PaaI family thioesterase [Cyclobacteriaceae bacterium]